MKPEERTLNDYLEDIREIRATMLRAENRLHVPSWFFFTMAALIALGTAVHAAVSFTTGISLTTSLLAIWLPFFLLAGVAEVTAWVSKGRREGLPWLSRSFGRFLATVGGIMLAVTVIGIAALMAGFSAAGIVLILSACAFHGYAPYSPPASVWIGWVLLAPGTGLLLAGVTGPVATVTAAVVVVVAFVTAGLAENRCERDE